MLRDLSNSTTCLSYFQDCAQVKGETVELASPLLYPEEQEVWKLGCGGVELLGP